MKSFFCSFVLPFFAIIFILVSWFVVYSVSANEYPLTTVVFEVSKETDIVTVVDFNGNLWQFKGTEDWEVGDICSCIMKSKGTSLIKDDEIKKTRYDGWVEGWNF